MKTRTRSDTLALTIHFIYVIHYPRHHADYGVKNLKLGGGVAATKINLFDFSGLKEFCGVRKEFYKDTQGALLVYNVGKKSSLEALESWLDEAKRSGSPKACKYLVLGNKIDVNKKREVTKAEGEAWAKKRNMPHFEVSAKSGKNVKEAFLHLFRLVLEGVGNSCGGKKRTKRVADAVEKKRGSRGKRRLGSS